MTNCLITKRGRVVDCNGGLEHDYACEHILKVNLHDFLCKRGGVRIKSCWPDTESIAIEYYYKPTEPQLQVIRRILRQNDYYTVILNLRIISKFRPIRGFKI